MSEENLEFEVSTYEVPEDLEEGVYPAKLTKIEPVDTDFGKSLRWIFEVDVEGEKAMLSGITSTRASTRSKMFKWFATLGGQVRDGKIDLKEIIGAECMVKVEKKRGRGGAEFFNVTDVMKKTKKKGKKSEE